MNHQNGSVVATVVSVGLCKPVDQPPARQHRVTGMVGSWRWPASHLFLIKTAERGTLSLEVWFILSLYGFAFADTCVTLRSEWPSLMACIHTHTCPLTNDKNHMFGAWVSAGFLQRQIYSTERRAITCVIPLSDHLVHQGPTEDLTLSPEDRDLISPTRIPKCCNLKKMSQLFFIILLFF